MTTRDTAEYVSDAELDGLARALQRGMPAGFTVDHLGRVVAVYGQVKLWFTNLELAIKGRLDIVVDGDGVTVQGEPARKAVALGS